MVPKGHWQSVHFLILFSCSDVPISVSVTDTDALTKNSQVLSGAQQGHSVSTVPGCTFHPQLSAVV